MKLPERPDSFMSNFLVIAWVIGFLVGFLKEWFRQD